MAESKIVKYQRTGILLPLERLETFLTINTLLRASSIVKNVTLRGMEYVSDQKGDRWEVQDNHKERVPSVAFDAPGSSDPVVALYVLDGYSQDLLTTEQVRDADQFVGIVGDSMNPNISGKKTSFAHSQYDFLEECCRVHDGDILFGPSIDGERNRRVFLFNIPIIGRYVPKQEGMNSAYFTEKSLAEILDLTTYRFIPPLPQDDR